MIKSCLDIIICKIKCLTLTLFLFINDLQNGFVFDQWSETLKVLIYQSLLKIQQDS